MKPTEEQIAMVIANSYKNFHTKGLDYICLMRSSKLTRKVYFFDGDVSKLPEVVNPHDHRYDFNTVVLAGEMSNSLYTPSSITTDPMYNMFEWRTPLNGGAGFTFKREMRLRETTRHMYSSVGRQEYYMLADEFHTIRMHSDQALLLLDQYEDVVPIDAPTTTFMKEKQAPSLDGLYERFTEDEILKRLKVLAKYKLGVT